MVYALLVDNKLNGYYTIEAHPGVAPDTLQRTEAFSFLDDSQTVRQLVDFSDGEKTRVTFKIPQMHCSSCIWLLENLYKIDPGVTASRVNFLRKELAVTFEAARTSLRKVVELLASIGYPPQLQLENLESTAQKTSAKTIYFQIGLAGFAFANIMLFSFPDYLAGETGLGESFQRLFGFLSLLLALPVLLYSSRDYFASAVAGLRQRVLNIDVPISIGILAIFTRSAWEILTGAGSGYLDSFSGLVFFLLIGKLFQQKTYVSLAFDRDYKSYFPISITRLRNGRERVISLSLLEKGDHILIRNRELIPADAVLLSPAAIIDYSFVTGESKPVHKKQGDLLFAGGRQIGEAIEVQTIKEVSQSYLTSLWNHPVFQKPELHPLRSLADTVGKYFTLTILGIAAATAVIWAVADPARIVASAVAVLIIACPCALALSIPFTLGTALRIFGRNKLYLKNTETIESLARVDTIVFDKTGTLTWQRNAGVAFHPAPGSPASLTKAERIWIASLVRHSTHPLSQRIGLHLREEARQPVIDFEEMHGAGISGAVGGQVVRLGSAAWLQPCSGPGADQPSIARDLPGSAVHVQINGAYRGAFVICSQYRDGMRELLGNLQRNYELHLISGDNDAEKPHLEQIFGAAALHFNQTPQQKLAFITALQRKGKKVLMIGDGLNDAGALKQSHVGISVSEDVAAFSPACDGILDGSRFGALGKILQLSRKSDKIIKASFGLSFLYNVVGLSFAVSGTLSPLIAAILMPLSSVSVVAFTTFATKLQARKTGFA